MNLFGKMLGRTSTKSVTWLGTDELSALLNDQPAPLLIDVRSQEEFVGPLGHIDGAESIPLDQLPVQMARLLTGNRALVIVCHTDRRSVVAAEHIRRAGGTDIAVLRGGMVAWRSGT